MFKRIVGYFVSPIFAGDEGKTRVASLLNVVVLSSLVGAVLYVLNAPFERIPYIILAIGVILSVWLVMKRGYIRVASVVVVMGLLAVFGVAIFTGGGLRAPAYSGLTIVILLAGLLLGWGTAMGIAIFSVSYGILLLIADALGMSPKPTSYSYISLWIIESTFFVMAGTLLTLALRLTEDAFRRANKELAERKQAEAELRQSEERYRKLINSARDVIFTISTDGRITSLNPAFDIFTGWSRADWLDRNFDELVAEDDRGRAHQQFERILRGETVRALRLHMHARSGEILVVEMNISPQFKDDKVIGLSGIARDMTQEQQAEDALKASEKRFRALIENGWDAFTLADAQGTILYASPSTQRVLGYTSEEFVGVNAFTLFHPDDMALARAKLIEAMQAPGNVVMAQVRTRHKDGTWRWMEGVVTNLFAEPNIQALVTNYRDITERKHAEAALRESQGRLSLFFNQSLDGLFFSMLDAPQEWNDSMDKEKVLDYVLAHQSITEVNDAMLEQYGAVREKFLGRTASDFFAHALEQGRQFRRNLFDAGHLTVETEERKDDGTPIWIEGDYVCMYDDQGRITGMFGIQRDITERKHIAQQFHYQASLLANINDVIIASDENNRITAWNSAAELMYGWKTEEVLGQIGTEIVQTDFGEASRNEVLRVLAETGKWRGEVTQVRKDGSRFHVETASITLRDAHGKITGYVSVNRDVTERKRAEDALREQQARQQKILDAMFAFVGLFSLDGILLEANRAPFEVVGLKAEDVIGKPFADGHFWSHSEATQTQVREAIRRAASGERVREDFLLRVPGGELLTIDAVFSPLHDSSGKVIQIVGSSVDITERKRAEEKIQWQNQRLKALREIDTAILAADSVEKIVGAALIHIRELMNCQRASLTLIDWGANEALTFDVRTVGETSVPRGTRFPLALFQDMIQSLSKNQPVLINDLSVLRDPPPQIQNVIQDGLRSLCILPLFSENKLIGAFSMSSEITGFFDEDIIGLGREVANQVAIAITQSRLFEALQRLNVDLEQRVGEREKLITELTAKNAELERFAYTISHDLKSPLVTIKGFIGYLEQDALSGNVVRLKGDTRRIANAVEKMQELLSDLLELSRIGRFVNSPEVIPFGELADAAIEPVEGRIQQRGVTVQIQPNLPSVYVDRQRMTEVLQNLLENAAKYMGDQPQPRIEIGQLGEEHGNPILYIRDNGMGLKTEYHERIFGLFNKLDARSEGTGIGLALVRRIIEFHGGRIWVESEVDKGSTFLFTLPSRPQPDSVI